MFVFEPVPVKQGGNINTLADAYNTILEIINDYMDMTEYHAKTLALWTVGACLKDVFETFPILYINAPKASGKSRLLKILEALIPDSMLTISITEANLFRIPKQLNIKALMIDEAESVGNKGKEALRELLNSCYKKGVSVIRQRKNRETETYETDKFDPFMPVAIANIYGLDAVLESRSIQVVLDHSIDVTTTRKVELFTLDERFKKCRSILRELSKKSSEKTDTTDTIYALGGRNIYNSVVYNLNNLVLTDMYVSVVNSVSSVSSVCGVFDNITAKLLERIKETDLSGRDFELWLPLFVIGGLISLDTMNQAVDIAETYVIKRMDTNVVEDHDTTFLIFLNSYMTGVEDKEYVRVSDLRSAFRVSEDVPPYESWPSPDWIGKCLRRLNVVVGKKSDGRGRQVLLNKGLIVEKVGKLSIQKVFIPEKEVSK